ncbi:MAG TPA: TolC family protein [Polyangiaceae bacterium]|jgi:outer membrane protein TolC
MSRNFDRAAAVRLSKPQGLLVGCSVLLIASSGWAQDLSLASVVKLALSRNERAEIAEQNVVAADAAVTKARAAFLPSLNLTAGETYRPQQLETNTVKNNAATAALTLSQPLFNATAFPLYASAKHSYNSALYNHLDLRRQLAFDAARGFFAVIAQQRVLKAAQSRLDLANATLDDTQVRASAGLTSSNDVTRSQIEQASADQSSISANNSLQAARLNLEYLIAEPTQIETDLAGPTQSLAPVNQSLPGLVNIAIATRPDLASLRASAASASSLAEEPGLRFVPTLSGSASARTQDTPFSASRYVDTTLAINFNWAIWDGGVRDADADSRNAARISVELQLRALARRVEIDVRVAIAELTAARNSLVAAEQGQNAATRSEEETSVLYKQGLAKAIELVDSNSSKFDAEVAVAAAELGVRQAELDLRAALGLFPLDGLQ